MRLIDADSLAESIKECVEVKDTNYEWEQVQGLECALECIDEEPTVQPVVHWIPCSERLPDKPNVYTVTDLNGKVVRYVFNDNESSREYWRRCAKAWMPLPAPYQAESEE